MQKLTAWMSAAALSIAVIGLTAGSAWAKEDKEDKHAKVSKQHGDDEGEKQHADTKVKKQRGDDEDEKPHADAKAKKPHGDAKGEKPHGEDEDDQVISLEQVPDVARARILYEAGRNKLDKKIEQEKEDGKVFYEASWTEKGREVDIKVTADGKLVEKETKLPLAEAPKAVQATVRKVAGKTPVKEVEHVQAGKRVMYEAGWQIEDEKIEIEVAPDGKLLNRTVEKVKKEEKKEKKKAKDDDDGEENEEKVTLDEVPAAVRATILKAVGKNRIKEIEKETKDGRTIYEAGWKAGDQEIEIKVSPGGKVLSKKVEDDDEDGDDDDDDDDGDDDDDNGQKVTLDKLPAAVRATLLKAAGRNRIEEIEKETEDGHTVFEAEWKAGGKKVEVKVAPNGKLLEKEVDDEDDEDDEDDDDD